MSRIGTEREVCFLTCTWELTWRAKIVFLIENLVKENGKEIQENSPAENIARNLMNKFSISEQDQYEISGLHSYFIKPSTKSIKSAVKQRKIYRELMPH